MRPPILAFNTLSLVKIFTIILLLWLFIFNCYPYLVREYLVLFEADYKPANDTLNKGTYGDMFGALNTFFSGLAFIGLLSSIFIQMFIHEREQTIERLEKQKQKREKLIFLREILKQIITFNQNFINEGKHYLADSEDRKINFKRLKNRVLPGALVIVREKIDDEQYFVAFREFSTDNSIVELFLSLQECYSLLQNFLLVHEKCLDFYDNNNLHHNLLKFQVFGFIVDDAKLAESFNSIFQNGTYEDRNILYNKVRDLFNKLDNHPNSSVNKVRVLDELLNQNEILRINATIFYNTYNRTLSSIENLNESLIANLTNLDKVLES